MARAYIYLPVGLSTKLVNMLQTEPFLKAWTVRLDTVTSYDKRMTPIVFKVRGGVKGQSHMLDIVVIPC